MNSFSISKIARNLAIFTITLFVLGSCEKKDNTIGSGFLDDAKFRPGIYRNTQLIAYTTQKENIITSGSNTNLLGIYQDPLFGQIKSSFAIHMLLSQEDPNFGTNPVLDSVILTMPYLGKVVGDSIIDYNTDSIYGDKNSMLSLKISQLNKLIYPDSTYYSDIELPTVETIYDTLIRFSPDSIALSRIDTTDAGLDTTIISKIPAALRVKFFNEGKDYFQRNILDMQNTSALFSNQQFLEEHINGLVFEVDGTIGEGAIFTFNMFKNSSIDLFYKNDDLDDDGNPTGPQGYRLYFNSKYSRVNKYEFDRTLADPSLIAQLDPGFDTTVGSDYIFLQGISGIEANIKLFTDQHQLDTLREQGWLVNRAEIVYRVSDDNASTTIPPYRLLMANRDSLKVYGSDYRMFDYIVEPLSFDGYLNSDVTMLSDSEKRYYKFRITNFVSSILDGTLETDENGNTELVYDDANNYVIKLISFAGNESVSRVKLNSNLAKTTEESRPALYLQINYSKKRK